MVDDVILLADRRPTARRRPSKVHAPASQGAPRPIRPDVVVPPADTPHVLVAEDDPTTRGFLRELLAMEGYVVREARDGREALALLVHAAQPYVVLLDYMMPWLTGGDVLDVVARDPRLARDRAFLLTSACAPAPIQATLLLPGAPIPFLPKPFALSQVLDEIAEAARRVFGRVP